MLIVDEKGDEIFADALKTMTSYAKHFVKASIMKEEVKAKDGTDNAIKERFFTRKGDSESVHKTSGFFKNW